MLDRETTYWGSADGRVILIKDLTTPHLVNILNWIKQHKTQYEATLYPFLEQEVQYRSLLSFAKNKAIPFKLDTGWYAVRNQSTFAYAKSLFYKWRAEYRIAKQQPLMKRVKLLLKGSHTL